MKPSKKITLIRQEIRESNDSKEKSKDKTATGKQYPSLNKSAPDIRKTMTALSHIQGIAIISDLFDNEDSITDMEMDTDDDDFSEHICHVNMVSVHGGLWGDDDMIDIQATYRFTNKCVHNGKYYAISDGSADSCILGSCPHVINRTKRYDPKTT